MPLAPPVTMMRFPSSCMVLLLSRPGSPAGKLLRWAPSGTGSHPRGNEQHGMVHDGLCGHRDIASNPSREEAHDSGGEEGNHCLDVGTRRCELHVREDDAG